MRLVVPPPDRPDPRRPARRRVRLELRPVRRPVGRAARPSGALGRRHCRCVRGTHRHADDLLRTQRIARRPAHRTVRGGDRPGRRGELRRHDGPGGDDPRRGRRLPGRRLLRPGRRRPRRGRGRRASRRAARPTRWPRSTSGSRPTTGRGSACRGRARVVIYDTRTLCRGRSADVDRRLHGSGLEGQDRLGPDQRLVPVVRDRLPLLKGDDAAKAWLEGIQANEPKVYEAMTRSSRPSPPARSRSASSTTTT